MLMVTHLYPNSLFAPVVTRREMCCQYSFAGDICVWTHRYIGNICNTSPLLSSQAFYICNICNTAPYCPLKLVISVISAIHPHYNTVQLLISVISVIQPHYCLLQLVISVIHPTPIRSSFLYR